MSRGDYVHPSQQPIDFPLQNGIDTFLCIKEHETFFIWKFKKRLNLRDYSRSLSNFSNSRKVHVPLIPGLPQSQEYRKNGKQFLFISYSYKDTFLLSLPFLRFWGLALSLPYSYLDLHSLVTFVHTLKELLRAAVNRAFHMLLLISNNLK